MSHDKPFMMSHLCFQTWQTLYNVLNNDRLESLSPQNTKWPLKGGEASTIGDLDEADKLLTQPHYKGWFEHVSLEIKDSGKLTRGKTHSSQTSSRVAIPKVGLSNVLIHQVIPLRDDSESLSLSPRSYKWWLRATEACDVVSEEPTRNRKTFKSKAQSPPWTCPPSHPVFLRHTLPSLPLPPSPIFSEASLRKEGPPSPQPQLTANSFH